MKERKAAREKEKKDRQAGQQLQNGMRSQKKRQKNNTKALLAQQQAIIPTIIDVAAKSVEMTPARPRRQTRLPQHLSGYVLS